MRFQSAGHKEERQEEEQHRRYLRLKRKVIGAWILVVPLLIFSMVLMHVPYSNEIQLVLTIPVLVLFGGGFSSTAARISPGASLSLS